MNKKDNGFLKRLAATFKVEAEEHIQAISSGLLELEKTSDAERQNQIIETVFREAHSLKGAARSVNSKDIEAASQSLESVFAALKRQELTSSPELFDLLNQAIDSLRKLSSSTEVEPGTSEASLNRELIQRLESAAKGGALPSSQAPTTPAPEVRPPPSEDTVISTETVRISVARLSSLLLQTEEFLSTKMAASQRVADLQNVSTMLDLWNKEWAKVDPEIRKYQQLLKSRRDLSRQDGSDPKFTKLVEFLDWSSDHVRSLDTNLKKLAALARSESYLTGSMVDSLLENMRSVLMLPFSSLLEIFPKFVRDLSRAQRKEVNLVIRGEDIEIDRRILEEMKDPLIHLVRNCIDHGIEISKERQRNNKPPQGTITISVSQESSERVEIVISDDGAGIDITAVGSAAVKHGIVSQEEANKLSEQESLWLIFQSGVTTSSIITDISGRGLGLAIVYEKVQKLGGEVFVETAPNMGVTCRILLPLTLATFRGVLVRAGQGVFVVPTANVEQVVRVKKDEIKTVENREAIELDGRAVPLVWLEDALELPRKSKGEDDSQFILAFVVDSDENRIAFGVDEVLNEQAVLVKSLGENLSRVRNIGGATVLPTGEVVPIISVPDLMKSAVKVSEAPARAVVSVEKGEVMRKILVVEDSITTRVLLKNILDSAGYNAKTAVDGIDAFNILKTEDFDLVVSDIDMPRMDGFNLTAKIRADKKLSELPVVLVTALESRDDQERGIEVGADAYIVKSSFDQSNLLDTIRRLI